MAVSTIHCWSRCRQFGHGYLRDELIMMDVVHVEARPDYSLFLEFENGERRVFDTTSLMDKKPFDQLKGSLFMKALVDYGTVVWAGQIDIAPETCSCLTCTGSWD